MKEEAWHRRRALMLASQLPENTRDALLVLRAVHTLINDFLLDEEPRKPSADVIKLREV